MSCKTQCYANTQHPHHPQSPHNNHQLFPLFKAFTADLVSFIVDTTTVMQDTAYANAQHPQSPQYNHPKEIPFPLGAHPLASVRSGNAFQILKFIPWPEAAQTLFQRHSKNAVAAIHVSGNGSVPKSCKVFN